MNDDNRVIVVEAGTATAYGSAVEGGYTGTYEDFCRQQAGYAESAAAVEQAKNTAVSAASTATAKAGEAAKAATAAQNAKTQTEQSASQALTDIAAARSGAISAVQTEGVTQTANATAQAQAAAQSATTASTKASEASASATTATTKATEAAASATSAANAASAAQGVLESIPEDYSDLSEDVDKLKADLLELQDGGYVVDAQRIQEKVNTYLASHPEVSVLDGSLTESKFSDALKLKAIKDYVTPEMFGAVGDGVSDDTIAMNLCFMHQNIMLKNRATYKVDYIDIESESTFIDGRGATILFNSNRLGQTLGSDDNIYMFECLSNRKNRSETFGVFYIKNVTFNGSGVSFGNYTDYEARHTSFIMLQLFNYKKVSIESCVFYDTIQDAVYLSECKNVRIKCNTFDKIAYNTKLVGTRNAITASSTDKKSVINISDNEFTYVYDECMRINNYSVADIYNNSVYHCYQYFVELFFNGVSGYDCCSNIKGNTINELADSFIVVDSTIATTLKLNVTNNVISGLGSANIVDNDHAQVYFCNVLNCAYNSDNIVLFSGNYVEHENSGLKTAPLINALYAKLVMKSNTIVLAHNVSSTNAIINAKEAVVDGNKIVSGASKTPSYTTFIAGINPLIQLLNNLIDVTHERTIGFNNADSAEIHVINNSIKGLTASGNLVRTKSGDVVPYIIVSKNILKSGRYLTYSGTVTNLIFTDNIVPTNFLLPTSTTYTSKVEANNLLTLSV